MIKRREFIAGLGSAAAWPVAARGQQGGRTRRVGMLMHVVKDDPSGLAELVAFRQGLVELGWVEGRNIDIELRWPGGDIDAAETLAKELVTWKPDVLLSRSTPATAALKKETRTIPIVFVNAASPVEQGFVQNLARPGGNITGFTNFESSVRGMRVSKARAGHRESVSQALERIRKVAREKKKERFTALFHHIDTELLGAAFAEIKEDAAPGVDQLRWTDYEADLERNLEDLHDRVQCGAYRALPSRRVYIPKPDGRQRPLAVAALEDKIVQRAVAATVERDLRGRLSRVLVRVSAGTRRA
jgi:ABC transporter substrate binding protein